MTGKTTDTIGGRAKQAAGAITGDEKLKREGRNDERKGKLKGKVDDAVDKAKDALDGLRERSDKA